MGLSKEEFTNRILKDQMARKKKEQMEIHLFKKDVMRKARKWCPTPRALKRRS
jgi:hypothetical protein